LSGGVAGTVSKRTFPLIRNTHLHEAQDAHRAGKPHYEDEDQYGLAKQAFEPQRARERHVPKYLRQLRVCKRQRPKTQVGGRMRDTAEAEFDRVNHLMDYHLTKVVLLLCLAMNNENETVQIEDLVSNLRVRHPYLPQSPAFLFTF
jgi:hypothetical protein